MNRAIVLVLSLGLLACSDAALAWQRVAKVGIEVLDAETGDPIAAKVTVEGDDIDGAYLLPPDSGSSLVLDVRADAGSGYYPRSMTLFLEASQKKNLLVNIHLARRNPGAIHNRRSVAAAAQYLAPLKVDRAVALLEAIVAETSPTLRDTQFGVYLHYNLWRAYFNNCTQRFVDQCTEAETVGAELLELLPAKQAYFDAERISVSEITAGSAVISDHAHRLSYLRAKWDLARNHPDDALESLERLMSAVDADAALPGRLRIRKADIELLLQQARNPRESP